MLWTGALFAVTLAATVLTTLWTLAELRGRPAPGPASGETAEAMLGGQLTWRAARHLGGEVPPFLREMTTQLAAALAHSEAQARLVAALQCGPDAPSLLGSLAGGVRLRHVWVEVRLGPCAGSRDGVTVMLAPGRIPGPAAALRRCGADHALALAAFTFARRANFWPRRAERFRFGGDSFPTRGALGLPRR
jgi:hypothetical protein